MNIKINYSGGKRSKFISKYKIQIAILIPLLIFGIGPIVADQVTGGAIQNSSPETTIVESSVSPSPSLESSPSPLPETSTEAATENTGEETTGNSESDSESSTASVAPSPSKTPPHAVENQNMIIQAPRIQKVDPRAKQTNLPQINFYVEGSSYLMLCMNSSRGVIDIVAKGIDDSFDGEDVFIEGDISSSVEISGTVDQVQSIFNSFGGLRLIGPANTAVSGTNLLLRLVAISEPTENFALCADSASSSQRLIEIQPLGLQVSTKKNPLNLGDKTKKP